MRPRRLPPCRCRLTPGRHHQCDPGGAAAVSGRLVLEVMTPAGVVYSRSFGGFSSSSLVPVASASKWVSASVFLRLVERGVLSLERKPKALLVDRTACRGPATWARSDCATC